jgi:hypothetical protein
MPDELTDCDAGYAHSDPPECRAKRWNGTPAFDGPHDWHFFTYGPNGMYTGSCVGR